MSLAINLQIKWQPPLRLATNDRENSGRWGFAACRRIRHSGFHSMNVSRRRWLESLSLFGAALAAPGVSALGAATPNPLWRTVVGLNGFESSARKYKQEFPLWEILDRVSELGFDGIELVNGWPQGGYPKSTEAERIRALRRLYSGFGLQEGQDNSLPLKAPASDPVAHDHCTSQVVNGDYLFGPVEREQFVKFMREYECFCCVRVPTYCILSNHAVWRGEPLAVRPRGGPRARRSGRCQVCERGAPGAKERHRRRCRRPGRVVVPVRDRTIV